MFVPVCLSVYPFLMLLLLLFTGFPSDIFGMVKKVFSITNFPVTNYYGASYICIYVYISLLRVVRVARLR